MKKYKTNFSKKELSAALHANDDEAASIINDKDKWDNFKKKFNEFVKNAEKIPVIGGMIDDILCMVSLVDSYVKKEYRVIPLRSIISIVAALIYLLSPIDLIPDAVPIIGYLDDATVIYFILNFGIDKDLNKYRKWYEANRNLALNEVKTALAEEISNFIENRFLAATILSEDRTLKLLLTNNENDVFPVECTVKEIKIPVRILGAYDINDQSELMDVLETTLVFDNIRWKKNTKVHIFLEYEFEEKWDDYIIMEE